MCGIALELLRILGGESSASSTTTSSSSSSNIVLPQKKNDNVNRRGPNYTSYFRLNYKFKTPREERQEEQKEEYCYGGSVQIHLQVSVLKMRAFSTVIRQPIPFTYYNDDDDNNNDNNSGNNNTSQKTSSYFCWNGEVYQLYNKNRGTIENVSPYQIYDTTLVASLVQENMAAEFQKQKQQQQSPSSQKNNDTKEEEEEEEFSFKECIADSFSCLINAEYAFFVVTPFAIYYGRDHIGRRSFLRSSSSDNNNDNNNDNGSPATTSSSSWKLMSVVDDDDDYDVTENNNKTSTTKNNNTTPATTSPKEKEEQTPPPNNNDNTNNIVQLLEELPTGMVYEYRYNTGNITHVKIPVINTTTTTTHNNDDKDTCSRNSSSGSSTGANDNNNNAASSSIASIITTSSGRNNNDQNNPLEQHDGFRFEEIITNNNNNRIQLASEKLYRLLYQAVQLRMNKNQPAGILFSGGLDSAVLAALSCEIFQHNKQQTQPLYLCHVSFYDDDDDDDNDTTKNAPPTTATMPADLKAAKACYKDLQQRYPNQRLLFLHKRVNYSEIVKHQRHIRSLILPKQTIMDFNIGTALWFATSACSDSSTITASLASSSLDTSSIHSNSSSNSIGDHSSRRNSNSGIGIGGGSGESSEIRHEPPKVLLCGIGADEQMGGYGRHRKAFLKDNDNNSNDKKDNNNKSNNENDEKQNTMHNDDDDDDDDGNDRATTATSQQRVSSLLRRELDMDIDRLWLRNLGRDDRVVSDHGKECRYPFLDPHVMDFLRELPDDVVCDFRYPPGIGDKLLLRFLADQKLGLRTSSRLVKRAIQFGTRISHVSDKHHTGSSNSRRKAKGTTTI